MCTVILFVLLLNIIGHNTVFITQILPFHFKVFYNVSFLFNKQFIIAGNGRVLKAYMFIVWLYLLKNIIFKIRKGSRGRKVNSPAAKFELKDKTMITNLFFSPSQNTFVLRSD